MDEEASPSWTDIKQRARLLTSQGNFRSSLLDPGAYVLQEGVARYQRDSACLSETQSASSSRNHEDTHISEDLMETKLSASSSGDNSLASKPSCGQRRTTCTCDSDNSPHSSETCVSESSVNYSPSNYHCDDVLRIDVDHNVCRLEDMEASGSSTPSHSQKQSNCNESDDRGTSFGRGWWLSQEALSERRNSAPNTQVQDDGKDFGNGWWKSPNKNNSASCGTKNKKRDTSAPPSDKRKRVRNNSNGDSSSSFGSGWWVGRLDKCAEDKKDKQSKGSQDGLSKGNFCQCSSDDSCRSSDCKHKCRKSSTVSSRSAADTKPVLDLVPFKDNFSPELAFEFGVQVQFFKKEIFEEEQEHGRAIAMSLQTVPGLWKASLGGSRTSLLLQVTGRSSDHRKAANVRDIHGLCTVVVFTFLNVGEEIPGLGEDNPFIFMRGVHWHEFDNGRLGIKMDKRGDVLVSQ